jgi:hypothetical protein
VATPRRRRAASGYRCSVCGAELPTFGAMGNHARTHTAAERAAGRPPASGAVSRATRRIEDVLGGAQPDGPTPDDGDSPSPDADTDAAQPSSSSGRLRPSRAQVSAASVRISPELRAEGVRDSIRDAMPLELLADIIRSLSVAISEADGAGEAGYLSPIQSTQIATLLYDSTVDLVVDRFAGDVGRFKAGMAVLLIVVSKGRVHAVAIRARIADRVEATRLRPAALPRDEADEPTDYEDDPFGAKAREAMLRATMVDS